MNVVPQTVTNTQTATGTQTVTFDTAQGTAQNGMSGPSVSFQFSLNSITATVHYNGKTAQASSYLNNEFGISCGWLGCWPFWKIHIDTGVAGVFSLHFVGQVLGGMSVSYSISQADPVDEDAFSIGLSASAASAGAGLVALIAQGGPMQPEAPEGAALVVVLGSMAALSIGFNLVRNSIESRRSYLWGFILPILLGIPCALGLPCPEPIDLPVLDLFSVALALWIAYYVPGVFLPWPVAAGALLWLLFMASTLAVILTLT